MSLFDFERLEQRQLLAVNVTQSGGTLNIVGDAAHDAVRVDGSGQVAGTVQVFVDTDNDGTVDTLFGTFTGVANIKIDSKSGDDAVCVDDVQITGNLTIKTGDGGDCVILYDSSVGGKVSISTGDGNDLLLFNYSTVLGSATVNTGKGDDHMKCINSTISGKLNVKLGDGDDSFDLYDNSVAAGSKVNAGKGNDLFIHFNQPMPTNIALSGIETQQANYPTALGNSLTTFYNAYIARMGGQAVIFD